MHYPKIQAWAIVNNGVMFSVHATKKAAELCFDESNCLSHFKIVKLKPCKESSK